MSITLDDVINRQEDIIQEANAFGFSEIKIYYDTEEVDAKIHLTFIVSLDTNNPGAESDYSAHLAASLRNMLQCSLTVLEESEIKDLYREQMQEYSIPIQNKEEVIALFGCKPPKNIIFPLLSEEIQQQDARLLRSLPSIKELIAEGNKAKTKPNSANGQSQLVQNSLFSPRKRKFHESFQINQDERNEKKVQIDESKSKENKRIYIIQVNPDCTSEEIKSEFIRYIDQKEKVEQSPGTLAAKQ